MEDKASKKERSDTLVPVRMVAQYAYCPRLAFLEWVQKEWADNYFTEHGRYHHRRVDQGVCLTFSDAPGTFNAPLVASVYVEL